MNIGSNSRRGTACFWLGFLVAVLAYLNPALADEEERLVDLPPFDQIMLDANNNNAVLKVEPLELPGRKVPAQPEGKLTIRLLTDPTRPLEVDWASVQQVFLFEDVLQKEAARLTNEGKFDEAFDYYARMLREYPNLPGVKDAANDFLRRNALYYQQSGENERALAVLSALYERQPNAVGLGPAVDDVCEKMIAQYLREKNYAAARAVLDTWRGKFATLNSAKSTAWEQRFNAAAKRQVEEARASIAAKQYVAARQAMGRARDIWPDNREAEALLAELQRQNPTVSVGVFETSPRKPVRRIDDWAAMRTSPLFQPALTEMIGFGSEGGVYRSPYGEWVPDENGLRLSLKLNSAGGGTPDSSAPSAAAIARILLDLADPKLPTYRPEFADLLAGVSVEGTDLVHLDLKRPHVRPDALLQLPLSSTDESADVAEAVEVETPAPWAATGSSADNSMFTARGANHPQGSPQTIIESKMADDSTAVEALLNGEIDVLDRVPPWQLGRLRAARDVRVASYALPTVHVLVLNPAKPLSQEREFRRALCFALQRERIVSQVIAGGAEIPGFTAVSGPFPAGQSASDPLSYAYDGRIEPRPFEPRLATVLASVAWAKVSDPNGENGAKPMTLPMLTLAHPPDPVARLACATILLQLEKAGIPVKLLEITADELVAGNVDYDMRYAELAVWEPIADIHALFGADGLARELCSPYLKTAIRDLGLATNWKDVRAKLAEIHNIAHHDLPVIPLWQTVNFFAYRTAIQGIGEAPVTLYQNIDQWRLGVEGSVAGIQVRP